MKRCVFLKVNNTEQNKHPLPHGTFILNAIIDNSCREKKWHLPIQEHGIQNEATAREILLAHWKVNKMVVLVCFLLL